MPLAADNDFAGKKILYVDSYNEGWPWNDRIAAGIRKVLEGTGATLRIFYMDTKRNPSEAFKKAAGARAKNFIDTYRPDVLIASDDNAVKYVVAPYYLNADLPIVFCGVNWDASIYGLPCRNVTGMVEVNLVDKMLRQLSKFA